MELEPRPELAHAHVPINPIAGAGAHIKPGRYQKRALPASPRIPRRARRAGLCVAGCMWPRCPKFKSAAAPLALPPPGPLGL